MKKVLVLLGVICFVSQSAFCFSGGTKTIATPGTATTLVSTMTYVGEVIVKADPDNSGNIYIGGSDVDKTTENGVCLEAGDLWVASNTWLNLIYLDGSATDDTVGFTYQ
jgi:hypothetical protein